MSNFEFLKSEWSDIYALTLEAEECIYSKPVFACLTNRKALEKAVIWLYKNDGELSLPYDTSLSSLIFEQSFKNLLPAPLLPKINIVKKLGMKLYSMMKKQILYLQA